MPGFLLSTPYHSPDQSPDQSQDQSQDQSHEQSIDVFNDQPESSLAAKRLKLRCEEVTKQHKMDYSKLIREIRPDLMYTSTSNNGQVEDVSFFVPRTLNTTHNNTNVTHVIPQLETCTTTTTSDDEKTFNSDEATLATTTLNADTTLINETITTTNGDAFNTAFMSETSVTADTPRLYVKYEDENGVHSVKQLPLPDREMSRKNYIGRMTGKNNYNFYLIIFF